jgi:hypothetical protein
MKEKFISSSMIQRIGMLCVLAILVFACRKSSNDGPNNRPPDQNCSIVTLSASSGSNTEVYTMAYNSEGKVSTINVTDFNKRRMQFNYVSGKFTLDTYYDHWDGRIVSHQETTLNSQALPDRIIVTYYDVDPTKPAPPAGTLPAVYNIYDNTYVYNANGELQSSKEEITYPKKPALNKVNTNTYTWANGNMVKTVLSTGQSLTFEYYMDKTVQKGDHLQISMFLDKGTSPYKNKNLLKSTTDGTAILNIDYTYDEQGKVSSLTISGSGALGNAKRTYQYSCN